MAVSVSILNYHFSHSTRQKRNFKSIPMLLRRAAPIYLVRLSNNRRDILIHTMGTIKPMAADARL